jgi:hypothetical protein
MTDAQLEGIAAQALNMAKRDMERRSFNFLLASCHDGAGLYRMSKVEALIIERLGEDWLNHGETKDAGFRVLRKAVDLMPPEAVVFVTATNAFKPTAKLQALTKAEQTKLLNGGHSRHHQAVKEGLLEIADSLTATVQTPERVCWYVQTVDHGWLVGKPEVRFASQAEFDGRLKMFGSKYASTQ